MFGSIAKAVLEPTTSDQVADVVTRAVSLSVAGRPGPVIVVMPKDITDGEVGEQTLPSRPTRASAAPSPADILRAVDLIDQARCPVVIAGEMVSIEDAADGLAAFADASGVGVISAYRRQDTLDNNHPAYLGHLEINRAPFQEALWAECDLVISVGARLDGISTQDFAMIRDDQTLIHIFPDSNVLARWPSEVAMAADVSTSLAALTQAVGRASDARLAWRDRHHQEYLDFSSPGGLSIHGSVDLSSVVVTASRLAPAEAVWLTDSGTFARWVHRYHRFERPHTQAGPMSGAMGYGVPGGIGAVMARPDAPAIVFVGDGGFLMSGQELAAAAQHRLALKVVVCDNNAWGSILLSQQTRYGEDGIHGTRLESPDFDMLARGYGLASWRVETTAEFEDAFQKALAHDGPALVHLVLDERDISPFNSDPKV
jgi:acetolactate synthase-1/2/3 large subunit